MPNWCQNKVIFVGDKIVEKIKSFDFESNVYGCLFEYLGLQTDIGIDLNKELIGTKWDIPLSRIHDRRIGHLEYDCDKEYVYLEFDTAWSPPENGIVAISRMYGCEIFLDSIEYGVGFKYQLFAKNGSKEFENESEITEVDSMFAAINGTNYI